MGGDTVKIAGYGLFPPQIETPNKVKDFVDKAYNPAKIYQNRVHGQMLMLDNAAKDSHLKKECNAKKSKLHAAKKRKNLGMLGRQQGITEQVWHCAL
ncbi:hypothetical protein B0H17DRAFT_1193872 [Mycena rosella]|uniref:Uncharacterized protein n=1 Tax=Mycena rosella TaxID=1033263 RepID=A0AAD7GRW5_MYCRO|nr:hypothetical protein B0H17DRAFT_1193872 [Mycena rosella]